jgi:hypothetical protein
LAFGEIAACSSHAQARCRPSSAGRTREAEAWRNSPDDAAGVMSRR